MGSAQHRRMRKVMRRQNLLPEENVCKRVEQIILSKGRLIQNASLSEHMLGATWTKKVIAELMAIWKKKGRFSFLKRKTNLNSNISK